MPAAYTHTTRATGTILTASIYNADHQNHIDNMEPAIIDDYSANATEMRAVTDPGAVGSESLATTLAGELERLRYVLKVLMGGAQWYDLGGMVKISSGSTGSVASKQFASLGTTYKRFVLFWWNVRPATDAQDLRFAFLKTAAVAGTNNHSSYGLIGSTATGLVAFTDGAGDFVRLAHQLGNGAGESAAGFTVITLPQDTTNVPIMLNMGANKDEAAAPKIIVNMGMVNEATPTTAVDGFQLAMASGNISFDWVLFGVK